MTELWLCSAAAGTTVYVACRAWAVARSSPFPLDEVAGTRPWRRWWDFPVAGVLWQRLKDVLLGGAGSLEADKAMEVALMALSAALKAGRSLPQALAYAAAHTPGPLGRELQAVALQAKTGDWEGALDAWYQRRPTADVKALATALKIHRLTGGELAGLLGRLAASVRERLLQEGELRTRTIEARGSAIILAAAPFLLLIYMYAVQREPLGYLLQEPLGLAALAYGTGSWLAGLLVLRRLLHTSVPGGRGFANGRNRRAKVVP